MVLGGCRSFLLLVTTINSKSAGSLTPFRKLCDPGGSFVQYPIIIIPFLDKWIFKLLFRYC